MMRMALAFSAVALWPAPAMAADELGLSNDGSAWSGNLPQPLFDSGFRWVPGDVKTASFYVRNQSRDGALLDLSVTGTTVRTLTQTGDLDIAVRVGDGSWVDTRQSGAQRLVTSAPVASGQQSRVDVRVELDRDSANQSQAKQVDLQFAVRLTQGVGRRPDRNGHGDDHGHGDDDGLPGTGGAPLWVLLAGAGSVAAGATVVAAARKERRHERP